MMMRTRIRSAALPFCGASAATNRAACSSMALVNTATQKRSIGRPIGFVIKSMDLDPNVSCIGRSRAQNDCHRASLHLSTRRFSTSPSKDEANGAKPNDKRVELTKEQQERQRLKKELKRTVLGGALTDIRDAVKNEDSKIFQTSFVDDGSTLPERLLSLKTLSGKEIVTPHPSKLSAILIAFNQLGWTMLDGWLPLFPERSFQVVQVSVVESMMSRFFSGFVESSLKQSVPADRWDKVALLTGSFSKEKEQLGIENKAVGYVFITDPSGLIRVKGSGQCTTRDQVFLQELVRRRS